MTQHIPPPSERRAPVRLSKCPPFFVVVKLMTFLHVQVGSLDLTILLSIYSTVFGAVASLGGGCLLSFDRILLLLRRLKHSTRYAAVSQYSDVYVKPQYFNSRPT